MKHAHKRGIHVMLLSGVSMGFDTVDTSVVKKQLADVRTRTLSFQQGVGSHVYIPFSAIAYIRVNDRDMEEANA